MTISLYLISAPEPEDLDWPASGCECGDPPPIGETLAKLRRLLDEDDQVTAWCFSCEEPVTAAEVEAAHESVNRSLASADPKDWPPVHKKCSWILEDRDNA